MVSINLLTTINVSDILSIINSSDRVVSTFVYYVWHIFSLLLTFFKKQYVDVSYVPLEWYHICSGPLHIDADIGQFQSKMSNLEILASSSLYLVTDDEINTQWEAMIHLRWLRKLFYTNDENQWENIIKFYEYRGIYQPFNDYKCVRYFMYQK